MDIGEILQETLRGSVRPTLGGGGPSYGSDRRSSSNLDYRAMPNQARELIYSILSQDQRQKLETEWETDFSYSLYGQARFRVNAYFQRGTLGAAFRLVPVR